MLATLEPQRRVVEQRTTRYLKAAILEFEDDAGRALRRAELEAKLAAVARVLRDPFDLVQRLDARLRLLGL